MGQPSKTFLYLLLLYIILISREYIQRNPYQFFFFFFFLQLIPKKKKKKMMDQTIKTNYLEFFVCVI
jgi:hypothetical protein